MRVPNESIALTLLWGDPTTGAVLAASYLAPGATFTLGDDGACDACVPAAALGTARFTIASWDEAGPRVHVPLSGHAIFVTPGAPVEITFGAFSLIARRESAIQGDREDFRAGSRRDGLGSVAASLALHAVLLMLLATRAHAVAAAAADRFEHDALTTRSRLLAASAQRDDDAARTLDGLGDVSHAVYAAVEPLRHAEVQPPPRLPAVATSSPELAASPPTSAKNPFVPLGVALPAHAGTKSEEDAFADAIQAQIAAMDPLGFGHVHGEHRQGPSLGKPAEFPSRRVPAGVIDSVVKANAGRIQMCLALGTRRDPALAGEVDVRFVIGATGEVVEAHDAGGELADLDVRRCLVRTFASLSFPRPPLGTQTVTFPIALEATRL
jgi:hypothetical protein